MIMSNYSISSKKIDKIYKDVSDDIMDARIKVTKLLREGAIGHQTMIESVLSDLNVTAPQKAIDIFKKKMIQSLINKTDNQCE